MAALSRDASPVARIERIYKAFYGDVRSRNSDLRVSVSSYEVVYTSEGAGRFKCPKAAVFLLRRPKHAHPVDRRNILVAVRMRDCSYSTSGRRTRS